ALLDRDLAPLGPERRARAASRAARERAAAGGALRTRTEMKRARAAQSLISVRVLEPDGVAEKQVRAQRERGRGGEPVDLDPGERERPQPVPRPEQARGQAEPGCGEREPAAAGAPRVAQEGEVDDGEDRGADDDRVPMADAELRQPVHAAERRLLVDAPRR